MQWVAPCPRPDASLVQQHKTSPLNWSIANKDRMSHHQFPPQYTATPRSCSKSLYRARARARASEMNRISREGVLFAQIAFFTCVLHRVLSPFVVLGEHVPASFLVGILFALALTSAKTNKQQQQQDDSTTNSAAARINRDVISVRDLSQVGDRHEHLSKQDGAGHSHLQRMYADVLHVDHEAVQSSCRFH